MSKANRRFYRSVTLGLIALSLLLWTAMDQFGLAQEEILSLLMGTLWIAGGIILLAALCVFLWVGLRKLLRRDNAE